MVLHFDATVDFETEALNTELMRVVGHLASHEPMMAIVRASGDNYEIGEIYTGESEFTACDDDMVAFGYTVTEVADKLRAYL